MKYTLDWLTNPEVFAVNRIAAHSAIWQCLALLICPASSSFTFPENDMYLYSFHSRIFFNVPVLNLQTIALLLLQSII